MICIGLYIYLLREITRQRLSSDGPMIASRFSSDMFIVIVVQLLVVVVVVVVVVVIVVAPSGSIY